MIALALVLAAQPAYDPDVAARLVGGALTDGVAWSHLEELVDTVGPRLSGSPGAEAAVRWGLARMKDDGLQAHLEAVKVPHWVRGEERGEILASSFNPAFPLALTALGGSVATPAGGVTGEVLEARSLEEIAAFGEKARGHIIFLNHTMGTKGGYGDWVFLRSKGASAAAKVGAVAVVLRSLATASLRTPHTGAMGYADGVPKIPAAAISVEDAELIHRLLARGPVRVRLGLGCRTLPDADSHNVVGEVRGREKPDEVVVLGAHLDSWDLAQGAEDDGAGVAIIMEAGRLIAHLPQAPRRTVRIVLYMNEENGLAGGKGYAAAHEKDNHVAALEMDSGGARPLGIVAGKEPAAADLLRPWLSALDGLGVGDFIDGEAGGADVSPLAKFQVPMVGVRQDGTHYFDLHHSPADTLDHLQPKEIAQSAAAVAWIAYALAEMPQTLPRGPVKTPISR